MKDFLINVQILQQATEDIRKAFGQASPKAALVLGSGWGDSIEVFNIKAEISFNDISGLAGDMIMGHAGKVLLADYEGKELLIFQGRRHYYEGLGWTPVVLPAFVAKQLGCTVYFSTNACGGVTYRPGELMAITDHINYMGANPLMGEHHAQLGVRFPDMTKTYDPQLLSLMNKCAEKTGVGLKQGVYMAFWGPTYETPAEVKMAKILGADVVGMSTVPENTVANAMGLRVAGLSCITNYAAGLTGKALTHEEVFATLQTTMKDIRCLLPEIIVRFLQL